MGAAIDAEIARAVEMGIDEAAVTAGWEAYFEVIGAGGTPEEAATVIVHVALHVITIKI